MRERSNTDPSGRSSASTSTGPKRAFRNFAVGRGSRCINLLDIGSSPLVSLSTMKSDAHSAPRVSYLVKWVERGLRLRLDAALHELGVSAHEYTALSVLARRDGLSSAQLARRTLVTAQAMNQLVIGLEKRGFIARKADPEHNKM